MSQKVRVFAPASVANVAVGYDILGFALHKPGDEVVAYFKDTPGLEITQITGVSKQLPLDVQKNTAGFAAYQLLEHLGETQRGIGLEIHKKMPFGSGLGSSAASAVGGVMAVNELLGRPLDKRALLPFAVAGEQIADGAYHADNVAPSLLGGIIFIRSNELLDVHSLHTPACLHATVIYPEVEVLTREARSILQREVSLPKVIQQSGNLGAFIVGLFREDTQLIGRALEDVIIEPQRAILIPHFYAVKDAALSAGALGCSISGAGPSIFALSTDSETAEAIGQSMQQIFRKAGIASHLFISPINQEGAVVL
ncbi:MAG: homoserine kinase [Haliscomenobacter sp.]